MKNKITIIAAGLLGLVFVVFGLNFFLKFIPIPPAEEGSHAAAFMGAMFATGYLTLVKILEIVGGILVAIPKTRNIGLLVLGPIVLNILAFNVFIAPGGFTQPPVILITVLSAFLLWMAKDKFANLIN
jgi:uncharacterized membrane protein YphA (DoxX/SURF4 family)